MEAADPLEAQVGVELHARACEVGVVQRCGVAYARVEVGDAHGRKQALERGVQRAADAVAVRVMCHVDGELAGPVVRLALLEGASVRVTERSAVRGLSHKVGIALQRTRDALAEVFHTGDVPLEGYGRVAHVGRIYLQQALRVVRRRHPDVHALPCRRAGIFLHHCPPVARAHGHQTTTGGSAAGVRAAPFTNGTMPSDVTSEISRPKDRRPFLAPRSSSVIVARGADGDHCSIYRGIQSKLIWQRSLMTVKHPSG